MVKIWTNVRLWAAFCLMLLSSAVFADDFSTIAADATSPLMSVVYVVKVILWIGGGWVNFWWYCAI